MSSSSASLLRHARGVTFDVGGTLIEPWPSVGQVYAEAATQLGYGSFDPADLELKFRRAWKTKDAFDYSPLAWKNLVSATFHGLLEDVGPLFAKVYARFGEASAWRIYPDVLPTLEALRCKGLKLGVISNWDDRLPPLLDALGLSKWFDATVVSCELKSTKPNPLLFALAAERIQLPASELVHVGDSRAEDQEGARAAGFAGVWLNRGAAESNPESVSWLTDLL